MSHHYFGPDFSFPHGDARVETTAALQISRLLPNTEISMTRRFLALILFTLAAVLGRAQPSLPSSFQAKTIHSPEGVDIFVRWGGSGPVVLLIHGYAENSDSWAPLAADLMKDHTVLVPDLRGIGRSSKPADGYDKKTQAKDMRAVVTALGFDRTFVVAHDIGNMVAYAYAAMYPDKVERLVVMDAPIPGIGPWANVLQIPGVWHFNFRGPDAERLVAGRERIYLDRIWNDFTGDRAKPDEATRNFFAATYTQPGGMRRDSPSSPHFLRMPWTTESSSRSTRQQESLLADGSA